MNPVTLNHSAIKEIVLKNSYVHGYDLKENIRLQDQASTLVELLHSDTIYPSGSKILEAGCGVGAQTVTLAKYSPDALFTSVDISEESLTTARLNAKAAGEDGCQGYTSDKSFAKVQNVKCVALTRIVPFGSGLDNLILDGRSQVIKS